MKKLTSLILSFILVFSTTVCFAHEIKDEFSGTKIYISNDWYDEGIIGEVHCYSHKTNSNETLMITIVNSFDNEGKNIVDYEEELRLLCEDVYSDERLAYNLSLNNNGANVTAYEDSVVEKYEEYNGVKFYRYEKAYTATAPGFYDAPFYTTAIITLKEGTLYIFEYGHNYKDINFDDIMETLKTVEYGKTIDIFVNGTEVYPDSAPVIKNDRTLVPIRAVVEAMGYEVEWDAEERAVLIGNYDVLLGIRIDSYAMNKITSDSEKVETIVLDVPAQIINDRTYVPLRAVGEALNCDVLWDGATRTININSK